MEKFMNFLKLEKWLKNNYPEVLEDAKKVMEERNGWDLADATDLVDSGVYNEYYESE